MTSDLLKTPQDAENSWRIMHTNRGRARKTTDSVVFLQQAKKGLQLTKLK